VRRFPSGHENGGSPALSVMANPGQLVNVKNLEIAPKSLPSLCLGSNIL